MVHSSPVSRVVRLGVLAAVPFLASPVLAQVSASYDASLGTLPSAQGWRLIEEGTVNYGVAGGILTQDTTPFENPLCGVPVTREYLYWLVDTSSMPFLFSGGGVVYEAEVRVIAAEFGRNPCSMWPRAGFQMGMADGSGRDYRVGFGSGAIYLQNNPDALPSSSGYTQTSFNTTGAFHVYRLEIHGAEATLFIDGVQALNLSGQGGPKNSNQIWIGDGTAWANSHVDIRRLYARTGCQPNLRFEGPGTALASLCGTGLNNGESSDYEITGAEPGAAGAFLISLPNMADVTLFPGASNPGTLVSGAGLAGSFPIVADASGNFSFTVPGLSTVADLVFQSIFVDSTVPAHGVAFTNAVLAQFGQ